MCGKILDLAIFSSQEALSLHFKQAEFSLWERGRHWLVIGLKFKISNTDSKSYACALTYVRMYISTLPDFTTAIQSDVLLNFG